MAFGDDHNFPLIRPPSRLEQVEMNLKSAIDILLALHALLVAKGLSSHQEIEKMTQIVADARPKLSKEFTVEQGIKAIIAAFRIEGSGDKGKGGK